MDLPPPTLTARFWRTRRSAAVAGIVFAVLLLAALTMMRLALGDADPRTLRLEDDRRALIRVGLHLVPFAGIAFLWFIGVVRDRIGEREDRLFATVFLGSGLLFVAMLFVGAAVAGGLIAGQAQSGAPTGQTLVYGRHVTTLLLNVYAMRMAAVFTLTTVTIARHTKIVSRWLTIAGLVSALILLFGSGIVAWAELLFPVWILALSIDILIGRSRASSAENPGTRPSSGQQLA